MKAKMGKALNKEKRKFTENVYTHQWVNTDTNYDSYKN